MQKKTFEGAFSNSGLACIGVGGGATTKRFEGRMVLTPSGVRPPKALRMQGFKDPPGSLEQAVVVVDKGSFIIEVSGRRPADPDNPHVTMQLWVVVDIVGKQGMKACEILCVAYEDTQPGSHGSAFRYRMARSLLPWEYLNTYRNRKGAPFTNSKEWERIRTEQRHMVRPPQERASETETAPLKGDLLGVLGEVRMDNYHGSQGLYRRWEEEIVRPALRAKGYRVFAWYSDSYGPLVRAITVEKDGVKSVLTYQ